MISNSYSALPPLRTLDSSNFFIPSASIESLSSQGLQEIPYTSATDASHSESTNMDLHSSRFAGTWVSIVRTKTKVFPTMESCYTLQKLISVPLMAAPDLSAAEEITEGVLTNSRAATTRRLSSATPPSDTRLVSISRLQGL